MYRYKTQVNKLTSSTELLNQLNLKKYYVYLFKKVKIPVLSSLSRLYLKQRNIKTSVCKLKFFRPAKEKSRLQYKTQARAEL